MPCAARKRPLLHRGTVTLDDVSFTTEIAIHSGGDAIAPSICAALLDTGSHQTFIRRDVLDRMLLVDAVADASRPFHVYCDACIDGCGAALEREQTDGSIKPIAYISRATLDSERH